MEGQGELFDMPSRRPPPRMAARPSKPMYTKFKPVIRTLCHDCVRDIHERGVDVAPFPSTVRWRRTHNGHIDLLCERHKIERVDRD